MRKVTLTELNDMLINKQDFKFRPINKTIYTLITALCNAHGVYFPIIKNKYKRDQYAKFVSVAKWTLKEYYMATPVNIEDQNQEEIELDLQIPEEYL